MGVVWGGGRCGVFSQECSPTRMTVFPCENHTKFYSLISSKLNSSLEELESQHTHSRPPFLRRLRYRVEKIFEPSPYPRRLLMAKETMRSSKTSFNRGLRKIWGLRIRRAPMMRTVDSQFWDRFSPSHIVNTACPASPILLDPNDDSLKLPTSRIIVHLEQASWFVIVTVPPSKGWLRIRGVQWRRPWIWFRKLGSNLNPCQLCVLGEKAIQCPEPYFSEP